MSDKVHIAISGKSGCGNTTVSSLVSHKLGFHLVNYTFRSLAYEEDLSFDEVCRLAETDDKWDRLVDSRQVEQAKETNSVLASRLAIWMLKDAHLKVYLRASEEIRAQRIQKREGKTIEEQMDITNARDKRDRARYQSLYGIDYNNYDFADLVINADVFSAEQIADIIIAAVKPFLHTL